jgi:hypothetical protein
MRPVRLRAQGRFERKRAQIAGVFRTQFFFSCVLHFVAGLADGK